MYDLEANTVLLYERGARGERTAPVAVADPHDPAVERLIGPQRQKQLVEAAAMISGAGTRFDLDAYRRERQTPVFFGSALNDFGVEPFLRALLALAPGPAPRLSDDRLVFPTDPDFSGFVFKKQANMNPRHRDRVAFVRICSGRLTKDSPSSTGAWELRFGCRGCIASLVAVARLYLRPSPGMSSGSSTRDVSRSATICMPDSRFEMHPFFSSPAERFAYLRPTDGRHKRFDAAVRQLEEEGLMQVFTPTSGLRHPIIGVVGPLQFDVVETRLQSEYAIPCSIEVLPHVAARWPVRDPADTTRLSLTTSGALTVRDRLDREVILFESAWQLRYVQENNPHVQFEDSM